MWKQWIKSAKILIIVGFLIYAYSLFHEFFHWIPLKIMSKQAPLKFGLFNFYFHCFDCSNLTNNETMIVSMLPYFISIFLLLICFFVKDKITKIASYLSFFDILWNWLLSIIFLIFNSNEVTDFTNLVKNTNYDILLVSIPVVGLVFFYYGNKKSLMNDLKDGYRVIKVFFTFKKEN